MGVTCARRLRAAQYHSGIRSSRPSVFLQKKSQQPPQAEDSLSTIPPHLPILRTNFGCVRCEQSAESAVESRVLPKTRPPGRAMSPLPGAAIPCSPDGRRRGLACPLPASKLPSGPSPKPCLTSSVPLTVSVMAFLGDPSCRPADWRSVVCHWLICWRLNPRPLPRLPVTNP